MMKNNLVFFRPITKDSDPVIKLVFNGMEIPFSTEKDKSIETKNKAFLVDGLNHFLEWAYIKGYYEFLNEFGIFVIELKEKLKSNDFTIAINAELKAHSDIAPEIVKGEKYADIFSSIHSSIIKTAIEYVDENIVYNSLMKKAGDITVEPGAKVIPADVPNLDNIEIFSIGIMSVLSKLITLGAILLGKGKLAFFTKKTISNTFKTISRGILGQYIFEKEGMSQRYNELASADIYEKVYVFLKTLTNQYIDKNIPTLELLEQNGTPRSELLNSVIQYTLATIYKINPIDVENIKRGDPYKTGDDFFTKDGEKKYLFTSRSVVNYTKVILKNNHDNKNIMVKHTNVTKSKRIMDTSDTNVIVTHNKTELQLERKDSKELQRRKDHIRILGEYVEKYLEEHNISNKTDIIRTPLTDYFVLKLLNEIAEDHITMKIVNGSLYRNIILMISKRLEERYLSVALALLATRTLNEVIYDTEKEEYINKLKSIGLFNVDPEKFAEGFFDIIGKKYIVELNPEQINMLFIGDEFLNFISDDEKEPFVFLEGYLYG